MYRRLGLSKRVFKEAVGHLYRLRMVLLDDDGDGTLLCVKYNII